MDSAAITTNATATGAEEVAERAKRPLTEHAEIRRAVILVNPLSGGVGPNALEQVGEIVANYACEIDIISLEGGDFDAKIAEAFDARPDVLFVLAGDGTAGTVASRAGPDGPLVAPLPGGTMNMLPRALYGASDWKAALKVALEEGVPQAVAGGRIKDGQTDQAFFCAAIFGSPALWAPAREAMRTGNLKLAWTYARRALKRAFTGRLRFTLDDKPQQRAEALVLISPMISKVMDENIGLEAAAMDPKGAREAFRLAAHAVLSDWRQDPAVTTKATRRVRVRARSRIPAVIDGEPILMRQEAEITFVRQAFRALAPVPAAAEDSV